MQFRKSGRADVVINIAPLVDVVFLLVIFFAVSTTFLETGGLKLELPTSSSSAQREVKEITVLLSAEGEISYDGEIVDRTALAERLGAALQDDEEKTVVLRADTATPHGEVVKLIDLIRLSGAKGLRVAARYSAEGQ